VHMRLVLVAAFLAACGGTTGNDTPTIESVTPGFGPLSGGTRIVIKGSGFLRDGATPDRVLFGSLESPQAGVVDDFTLEATVPAATMAGDVPITVFNRNGNVMVTGQFHYSSEPTISSVTPKNVVYSSTDTTVTLTGTGFKDENAGIVSVLIDGTTPAIDVQVQSDTQLTFTAAPGQVLARPDLVLTNTRGNAIKVNAYRYVPSLMPGLILFVRNSLSTFAIFYDPVADTSVTLPRLPQTPNLQIRGSYVDAAGDIWIADSSSRFGKLDIETQTVLDPVFVPALRLTSLARLGTTVFAMDRNILRFGSFDPATQSFTQIAGGIPCTGVGGFGCGFMIANDGTTMYLAANQSISTVNTTTGVRGTLHPMSPGREFAEMKFLGTTLYAAAGPRSQQNLVVSINPTTGANTIVHTFASGTVISAMEVFQP
jgi:hypothetical protein